MRFKLWHPLGCIDGRRGNVGGLPHRILLTAHAASAQCNKTVGAPNARMDVIDAHRRAQDLRCGSVLVEALWKRSARKCATVHARCHTSGARTVLHHHSAMWALEVTQV